MNKKRFIILSIVTGAVLIGTGSVLALNGYFGGGGSIPEDTFTRGLVGYWAFEDGSGTNANDSSDQNNDGTLTTMDPNTDWVSGKAGNGGALDFDGSSDYVNIGNDTSLDITDAITLAAWVKTSDGTNGYIITKHDDSFYLGIGPSGTTAKKASLFLNSVSASWLQGTSDLDDNTWHYVVGTYDGSQKIIYVDGVEENSVSASGAIATDVNNGRIGGRYGLVTEYFNGSLDEVRVYNRALTAAEIKFLYNRGGPVGHWKFDEGTGTTAFDSTNITNDGTITGSTWVQGQYGTALDLDGSDDVVTITNADPIDFDVGLQNAVTFSAWINADSDGENNVGEVIDKGVSTYIRVDNESSGSLDLEASIDLTTASATLNVSAALSINTWHHVVMVYEDDSDDEITLYVDGRNVGTSTNGNGSPSTDTNNLLIGGDTAANFDGTIDDVRVYQYARTAEEIRLDYNAGLAARFGGSPNKDINRGLVGYWDFEDGSGTNANDASDNNNDGTLTSMDPPTDWVSSKAGLGGALDFDGSDDRIVVSDTDVLSFGDASSDSPFTFSAWVNMDDATKFRIIEKAEDAGGFSDAEYELTFDASDKLRIILFDATIEHRLDKISSSAFTTSENTWLHVVATYDGSGEIDGTLLYVDGVSISTATSTGGTYIAMHNTVFDALIGGSLIGTDTFANGLIDDVRIYNRALSAAEVRYLYNKGDPIAHYKFEEGTGTTAFDSGTGGNNGTITGSTWVQGQYGTALDLDGSDDVVTITNADPIDFDVGLQNAVTFSAWINADSDGENNIGEVIDKGVSTYIRVDNESSGSLDLEASIDLATASATLNVSAALSINTWHHVVMVYEDDSDDEITLYVDGRNVGTSTNGNGSPSTDTNNLLIGGDTAANFDGTIDDVRVYQYARSPSEILQDYNAGLSTHFR